MGQPPGPCFALFFLLRERERCSRLSPLTSPLFPCPFQLTPHTRSHLRPVRDRERNLCLAIDGKVSKGCTTLHERSPGGVSLTPLLTLSRTTSSDLSIVTLLR